MNLTRGRRKPKTLTPASGGAQKPKIKRATIRGWLGPGAGEAVVLDPAPEYRGTTVQVCGLWPFAVGSGAPAIGVPVGRRIGGGGLGATVCCDPISWFQTAKLIRNPSMFVLGLPGLGKSTLIRRQLEGMAAFGIIPLVLGDVRPDYVELIRRLDGDVISLGGGRGYLNPLDAQEAFEAAALIRAAAERADAPQQKTRLLKVHEELLADAKARRATLVSAIIGIQRNGVVAEREDTMLSAALGLLDEKFDQTRGQMPVFADLLEIVQAAPAELRIVAVDRNDMARYQAITEELEASLIALTQGGRLGSTFSRHTSQRLRRDRPTVFDLGAIQDTQPQLRAAALMATWSVGFGTVNVAQALADAGLEPQRHYQLTMDEIHQALRAGPGMVERYDQLTRLNRAWAVGQFMITHTMKDLEALPTVEDREKAKGLVERSGMVVLGGLPSAEMPLLNQVVQLSQSEQALLAKWQEPPSWDPETGHEATPPGLGNFLIKVGSRPGIPFQLQLTSVERSTSTGEPGVHDTNSKWHEQSRITSLPAAVEAVR